MAEFADPILRVAPGLPLPPVLGRDEGVHVPLSGGDGDAPPGRLVHVDVDIDVHDAAAAVLGVPVTTKRCGHEVGLAEPDGGRLRVVAATAAA